MSPAPRSTRLTVLLLVLGGAVALVWWLTADSANVSPSPVDSQKTEARRRLKRRAPGPLGFELPPPTERARHRGRIQVRGGWGSGPGQFGRRPAQESNPEGPMSLALDGAGNLLILDQVNRRVQRFDRSGQLRGSLALTTDTAQDLLVDKDRVAVLDRLGLEPAVHLTDLDGQPLGKLDVVGGQISEGGAITGLFADADGIYVETGHDDLVRVGSAQGQPTGLQETIPGRPSRDGRLYLKTGVIDKAAGRIFVQAHDRQKKLAWESALNLGRPLLHILLLDSDLAGNVYVAAEVGQEDPATHEMRDLATIVIRLEGTAGQLDAVLELPPTTVDPAETFRPLVLGDDGTLYQLLASPSGITVTAYHM